jgi:hypothetical protein
MNKHLIGESQRKRKLVNLPNDDEWIKLKYTPPNIFPGCELELTALEQV